MGRYAQDVHIEIMGKMFVTDFIEYNDLEDDVLLGYIFLTKYEPLHFWKHKISLRHEGGQIDILSLKIVNHKFENSGKDKRKEFVKELIESLAKLFDEIKHKFEKDCCRFCIFRAMFHSRAIFHFRAMVVLMHV